MNQDDPSLKQDDHYRLQRINQENYMTFDRKQSKKHEVKLSSPICTLSYPRLGNRAKTGGQYDGEFGSIGVTLLFNPELPAHKAFITKVEKLWKKAVTTVADNEGESFEDMPKKLCPLREQKVKGDDGRKVKTGLYSLTCSKDYQWINNKTGDTITNKFNVVDSKGKPLSTAEKNSLYSGTQARVGLIAYPYLVSGTAGLKLAINLIQVTEAVKAGEASVSDFFDDEVDGFVSDGSVDAVEDSVEQEVEAEVKDF